MFLKSIGLLLLLSTFVSGVHADDALSKSKGKKASTPLTVSYRWYDGDSEHTVWLNPDLVAEFSTPKVDKSAVKRAYPNAVPERGSRGLTRIWRLGGIGASEGLQKTRMMSPDGMYSPVFNDGGTRKRALPGGIIVYFKPDWTASQISAWTASQGLSIMNKLEIGLNIYVLKTAPGLVALETANRIHKSGDVISAQPNWWVEVSTR